jgi:alpha-D-xyloside xylohydrolase
MKFSHGAWRTEEGVTASWLRRVNEYRIDGDTLVVCGLDRSGSKGADRFEGKVVEISITSPMPDVIRVKAVHHRPRIAGVTAFDLDYSLKASGVTIEDQKDYLTFTSGRLRLRIRKSPFEMKFEDGDSPVTGSSGDGMGYMQVRGQGSFMTQRLSMGVGECIYGMGERFSPLVRNGQSVAIWNDDPGTVSDMAYKNIPFYLSSRGYGLLVNTPGRVEFEVATERVTQVQFSTPGEALDYYVFYGPDPKDVLSRYTKLSGRAAVPPAWSFGLWLSTSFTTEYNEATVTEFVEGMAKRGIPLSVFHFDCFWMKERHWCNFLWDRHAFPDPKGMLKRLKARGLKICVWINPYISQHSELFEEGCEKGYLLKRPDGSVCQLDTWQPGMGIVDFTNPEAKKWYCGKLKALLDMGVDCFKTDFGELIPTDVVWHDGSDPQLMHNYYAYLYNKAVFELLESHHGKGNALVFARSATTGCQKFPVHWGGDCFATFESMAESLRGGLSFCTSGPAFWSHDMGGFEGTANPAVYKRWTAFGLLSTHSRLHGSGSYRVPWLFDEEAVDVMRHFSKLKCRLFPYLFAAAHDAAEYGWPVMRAMPVEFPADPACLYLDRQYMLGSSLLVAPVFRQDNLAEYYLPAGKWTNLLTGNIIEGPAWRRETMDFFHLPLFVRENTILPTSSNEAEPKWSLADELTLNLFQVKDVADISMRVVATDGSKAGFRCGRQGNTLTLECDGKPAMVSILLRSVKAIGRVAGGKVSTTQPEGVLIEWSDAGKPLTITLSD